MASDPVPEEKNRSVTAFSARFQVENVLLRLKPEDRVKVRGHYQAITNTAIEMCVRVADPWMPSKGVLHGRSSIKPAVTQQSCARLLMAALNVRLTNERRIT